MSVYKAYWDIFRLPEYDNWEATALYRLIKWFDVQAVNDLEGKTIVSASSKGITEGTKSEVAAKVGEAVAKKCLEAGITEVVFDRNGYLFHGRVKALADGARNGGLKF